MADNVYEGLFILDSNRYARDPGGVSGQIAAMVQKYKGTMLASRLWEERRLAYSIGGQRKGAYWLAYFRLDSGHLTDMRRDCALNDAILRELILKVEPRIVEALVSHAKSPVAEAAKPKPRPEPVAVAVVEESEEEGTAEE